MTRIDNVSLKGQRFRNVSSFQPSDAERTPHDINTTDSDTKLSSQLDIYILPQEKYIAGTI